MKLLKAILKNFKGISDFEFAPNGNNTDVFGDNGSGKTTLFDSGLWVLFNKDSAGNTDFELKTLDAAGKVVPMIDHSVELSIENAGRKHTLKKTLTEKWTKKKGAATTEFTGHETAFEIDGVPKAKKEFDAFIARLCDESLLRMLMDPDYFPGKMAWGDRRRILMDVCGNVTDAEVIDSAVTVGNKSMLDLLNVLNSGRTIDDHRKVLAANKTRLNDEIKAIPVRVDEATRALPVLICENPAALPADIESARAELQKAEAALLAVDQGGAVTEKKLQLRQIESDIMAAKTQAEEKRQSAIRTLRSELNELFVVSDKVAAERLSVQTKITTLTEQAATLNEQLSKLRKQWAEVDAEKMPEFQAETSCPSCGQNLPEDQVQAAIEKATAAFNLSKAERLTKINADGVSTKEKLQLVQSECSSLQEKLPVLDAQINVRNMQVLDLQSRINTANAQPEEQSDEITALQNQVVHIKEEIASIEENAAPEKQRLAEQINLNRIIVAKLEQEAAKVKQREDGLKRIAELKAKEKELAKEYQQLDKETFLTEEFIRTKVRMIETKINSRFKYARFRLFETQINGGINEICEVLGPDLVPYSKGLNNAARINTGLDIVNTLSEHYGFEAPVFVDNAEAVTQLIETRGQLIRLVVSGEDKKLRVEAG